MEEDASFHSPRSAFLRLFRPVPVSGPADVLPVATFRFPALEGGVKLKYVGMGAGEGELC